MKPKLLIGLPLLLLLAVSTAAQEKKLTAEEIIAKHLEAVGGKATLAKFKTRVALGILKKENDPETQFAIVSEAPNRVSANYNFVTYDLRIVYDGKDASIRPLPPRQLSKFTDKYQDMVSSGLMFNNMSVYNLLISDAPGDVKFEAKGMKKVGGRQAHVVQVKPRKGSTMKLYFDAENFMWVRTDFGPATLDKPPRAFTNAVGDPHASDELTVDFYIETSDFRDVDGLKLPFKFVQVLTRPFMRQSDMGTIVGTVREYQHNGKIDPKMFEQ
jgi:hypothetical protein